MKNFDLRHFLDDVSPHAMASVGTQYALAAAAQAWKQAGLAGTKLNRRRFGIYLGSGEGPLDYTNFNAANIAGWKADTRR